MAKLGKLIIEVDDFLKDTRMRFCNNFSCRYNNGYNCDLKIIEIDEDGKCENFIEE